MNMTTPSLDMLSAAIADACRLAPTFANEDGELIYDHLVAKFPDLATDAADLITRKVCINATAGSNARKWEALANDLLEVIAPWGDLSGAVPLAS